MASLSSFDVSTGADLQVVDYAVNQATKEVAQRYDFKGSKCSIAFDTVRREIKLTQGISQDKSKAIVKAIKDKKFKKAQASIQGEEVRVQSPSKDELQEVIAFLRAQDFGIELKFGNYRG